MTRARVPLLLVLAALAGCGTGPARVDPAADPAHAWALEVHARIAAVRNQPSFTLRYNPAACDCPPFEIQLEGVWHRVVFAGSSPDDEAIQALDTAVKDARSRRVNATWQVQGSLDDTLATCARGALVVALTPTAFGAAPATGGD